MNAYAVDVLISNGTESSDDTDGSTPAMRIIEDISARISFLHRFTNIIRKASRDTGNQKAATVFRMIDEDGIDVEPFLLGQFSNYLLNRFPRLHQDMRQRLASAMILQRKRVLYRRSQYGPSPIKLPGVPRQPPPQVIEEAEVKLVAPLQQQDISWDHVSQSTPKSESGLKSETRTATTLKPKQFAKASTPSVISESNTVALEKHESLVFPPAPRRLLERLNRRQNKQSEKPMGEGQVVSQYTRLADDIVCPFCFHTLSARDVADLKQWQ